MIVTRPKMARYDVYTLIKVGIDRRGLVPPLLHCLQEILHAKQVKNWSRAYSTAARTSVPSHLVAILFAGIVWGCGSTETLTSKYVTASRARHVLKSVSYRAMGRSILSLHYILLTRI